MAAFSPLVLEVFASEDGMKLLRFLERRLADQAPGAVLHKWIRTGQVRVNGGRAKPFFRLAAGDQVRIPPFARARELEAAAGSQEERRRPPEKQGHPPAGADSGPALSSPDSCEFSLSARNLTPALGPDVRVLGHTPHLLVLAKPAGLPCQPGGKGGDSLCARLGSAFAGAAFIPAPAHRIDRHTSGLVAVGLSHAAQRRLHDLFASGGIRKDYLAWVLGDWPLPGPCLLEDRLARRDVDGREGMAALPGGGMTPLPEEDAGRKTALPAFSAADVPGFAASAALALARLPAEALPRNLLKISGSHPVAPKAVSAPAESVSPGRPGATLLLLRLFTGRTHQLRVQLASRGFPIIGDGRYGGPRFPGMLLHAFALSLPGDDILSGQNPVPGMGLDFSLPPAWPAPFSPDPVLLNSARQRLDKAILDQCRPD